MGAPAKSTGGSSSELVADVGSTTAETTPSPRRARGGRVAKPSSPKARRSRRAEAIDAGGEGLAKTKSPPRHDTSRSARPRILEAARKMAAKKGYEPLRVLDITTEAKISHQSFYGHFANKRHAVAIATSDELGTIADLAMRGSKRDELWAQRLLDDIDKALVETYPATDGPERWLRKLLTDSICSDGFDALRIAEMIKVSRLGHGEFYRRYGGKRGCLRRIYSEVLEELRAEVIEGADGAPPISRLATTISSDPDRARLLILGASNLPDAVGEEEPGAATQDALPKLIAELFAESRESPLAGPLLEILAAGVHEVVRSAVVSDRIDALPDDLDRLAGAWRAEAPAEDGLRLAA